jgi:hypothetical protein
MDQITKEELQESAKKLFIKFPNMQSVTALGDGQFFDDATGGSSSARTYARENKIEVYSFDRSVLIEASKTPEQPVGDEGNQKAPKGENANNTPVENTVTVEKLKLGDLQSLATEMGLLYEPTATRAILIEMINKAKEA